MIKGSFQIEGTKTEDQNILALLSAFLMLYVVYFTFNALCCIFHIFLKRH